MKKLRMAVAALATICSVSAAIGEINKTTQSQIVQTQGPTGPVLRDLADQDNNASPDRWTCQNAQPTVPCYYVFNEDSGEYDIPSSSTGYAVTY